jgi:hypothetical protein
MTLFAHPAYKEIKTKGIKNITPGRLAKRVPFSTIALDWNPSGAFFGQLASLEEQE